METQQEYIERFLKSDRLGALLGARFVSLTKDKCVYDYEAQPEHYNPNGILHGGALYTIMDTSQGMLVNLDVDPEFRGAATGTATIKYLAPVQAGVIRVRTKITGREGRKIFAHTDALAEDGRTVASLDEIWVLIRK